MDGGSSLNLIYKDTVRKMGIDPSRIKPNNTTFKGVIPAVEARCIGIVMLEVVFGSPDNFLSKDLIFDIAPFPSGYHALLGRTAFAKFNAVLHYAYLKLKIPGPSGVITIHGNTECSLRTKEHTTALAAEDQTSPYGSRYRSVVKTGDNSKWTRTRSPSWEPACVRHK
ncbi:uncharacterized protein [Aegilops tauschii subsp. strangulata]|uniref:uncharacterized protein n=1 Tax=Aegilops tauschii subsp. strangulata TaxID=200361 RepID=UPI003CC87391